MGHSRQDGGFADFSNAPITPLPELPETARAGLESLRPNQSVIPAFVQTCKAAKI
jgi:hypothetical protein